MSSMPGKRVLSIVAALVVSAAVIALTAQSFPRPLQVAESAPRITGDEIAALGLSIEEFDASYRRWTRVLGLVPVSSEPGVVRAFRPEPGILTVRFELGGFGSDEMHLVDGSLVLSHRSFGEPGGPGQSFERDGNTIEAVVRAADGTTRELTFDYPVAVFEPSLLELPLALLDLEVGDEGRLAWSNFGDASDHWVPYRVLGEESITAAGRSFDTVIVRVGFGSGRQRDYWIASRPPYKVRMVAYERGKLVTSGWDLESMELRD